MREMECNYRETEVQGLIAQAVAPLVARIAAQDQQIAALGAEKAQLRDVIARLSKNSSNSSKPPSSDIIKPPPPPGEKRSIGGQLALSSRLLRRLRRPGHAPCARLALPPEQVDQVREYRLARCPDCGGKVRHTGRWGRGLQQIELADKPLLVTEPGGEIMWCPRYRKMHPTALPAAVEKAGLLERFAKSHQFR